MGPLARSDRAEEAPILRELGGYCKTQQPDAMADSPGTRQLGILPDDRAFGENCPFGELQLEAEFGAGLQPFA